MSPQELFAVRDLVSMLFTDAGTAVLMVLLGIAAFSDCRTRRIPNALVLAGILIGFAFNTFAPSVPKAGFLFALSGAMVGFALFLPLYLLRAIGAGDVKLLAVVGAFLGPLATLNAGVCTFILGGVLSVVFVIRHGTAPKMFENVAMFVRLSLFGALAGSPHFPRFTRENSAGRLPYALAIAGGTIGYLVLHQLGIA